MGDTHIEIHTDPPPPTTTTGEGESVPSSPRGNIKRKRGVKFASVTPMIGAVVVVAVAGISLFSFLTSSRAGSQSKAGQGITSEHDDQSTPLHIEKRQAAPQQGTCAEDQCLTEECVHAASDLLKNMDDSVDPCDDFYRYACGGWMKKNRHKVGGDDIAHSLVFDVLSEKIDITLVELLRTGGSVSKEVLETKPYEDLFLFYERCREVTPGLMDMTAVHEALRELDQFQVGRPFDASSWDLTRALKQLFLINGAPLFDITLDTDVKNPGKLAVIISSPRRFGLIFELLKHPLHRRNQHVPLEYLKGRGRRVLFGDVVGDMAVQEALLGLRPAAWRAAGEHLSHALQGDAVAGPDLVNAVPTANLKEEEQAATTTMTPHDPTTTTTTTTDLSTSSHTPSPSASLTTTITAVPTTAQEPHHTDPSTPPPSATNATSREEESGAQDEDRSKMRAVSRRLIYSILKKDIDSKRLEGLATALHDTFPNASVAASSSDGDVPDVYTEVMTRFLPILQVLLPSEREKLELQQTGKLYNAITLRGLQQRCPVIDWYLLIGELLNTTALEDLSIYLSFPDHLSKLCTLLDNTEPWVVHYAMLTLYSYDVLQETVYVSEVKDRDEFCLEAVKTVFGEVMTHLYLHHIGNDSLQLIKTTTSSMMESLREEVEESVSKSSWLSEQDKQEALQKLHKVKVMVGAWEKHWDIAYVNQYHQELSFPPNASFLQMVLEVYSSFRHQLYHLHHEPVKDADEFIWSFTVQPYVIGAFAGVDINSLVFPEAFFYPPFHRRRAPHYLNYGSTATSMAHEIFHIFDFLGIQFDHRGVMTHPFSEELGAKLNDTADCYNDLVTREFQEERHIGSALITFEIDEIITKSENVADISGIRTAFRAYRRLEEREGVEPRLPALPLHPHQLFFVSAAQPYCSLITAAGRIFTMELDEHLPNKIRINGMMKNLPEFSETFNCSSTSKMFASKPCLFF